MKNAPSLNSLLLTICLGALLWLALILTGSLLALGDKIGTIHPWLEVGFYVAVACGSYLLFLRPIILVLASPVVALEQLAGQETTISDRTCRRVAQQLIRQGDLNHEEAVALSGALTFGRNLREPLRQIIQSRKDSCAELIRQRAVMAFLATAISQSGRLEALVLMLINVRMVKSLVDHFGYRPPLPYLIKIYANIFATALLIDGLEDLDLGTFASHHGLHAAAEIPGFKLVSGSLLQGSTSALLTLRVGFITRDCLLNVGQPFVRTESRRSANREALTQWPLVLLAATKALPGTLGQLAGKVFGSNYATEADIGSPLKESGLG